MRRSAAGRDDSRTCGRVDREPIRAAWCSSGMKWLLAVIVAALALPAAAQAKEVDALAVCGPDACEDVDLAGFGHRDPIAGDSATSDGPPPSDFLRIDFTVDGQAAAFSVFYVPRSGLVALEGRPGHVEWARLDPRIAPAVKEAATGLETFPAPRVTGVRVGDRNVQDDPASYLPLVTLEGPFVLPKTNEDAVPISFEAADPNPWTQASILYYPQDEVILRGGTFVKLPDVLAADIRAARALGGGGGTAVPWLPIGVALAGAALLVALFLRTRTTRRRALVVAGLLALALPAGTAAKGPVSAELCGPDACREVAVTPHFQGSEPPPEPGPYYELRLDFGNGVQSRDIYYEPRSGLVSYAESYGSVSWERMRLDTAGLRPHPEPHITAAWVGDRPVSGDPSGYLKLVTLEGPWLTPEKPTDFQWIRLESNTPNPWTSQALVYYPRDRVLLTQGSSYVRVPDDVAVALEAARPLGDGARTTIPWIAIAAALAGAVALLLLRTLSPWSGSLRPSSSSTSSGRRSWRPGKTRRSSAAA